MGLLDFLLGEDNSSNNSRNHDRSVFDTDRFRNNGSGNWVDWRMLAQAVTKVTDLNIRITMRMESGNKINTIMFGIIVFLVLCINVLGTMTGGNDRW